MILRPSISRRALLQGAAALAATPAFAQSAWPYRNIRLIVPYPAGGSTGVLFRILAEKLKEKFGQSFVVENRPGASGNTGIDAVAKSAPDGYTSAARRSAISQSIGSCSRACRSTRKRTRRAGTDLRMSERRGGRGQARAAKTLPEFVAWAKAQPKGITIGSPGPGTTPHLSGVLFAARTGVEAVHVPFKGASETIPGDAVRRRQLRGRQSRVLRLADRIRQYAGARGHLRRSAGRPCRTCRRWRKPASRISS